MKYVYDREHDSLFVKLANRKYVESEEIWPAIVVDFDEAGLPIAIDFIANASRVVDVGGLAPGKIRTVLHFNNLVRTDGMDGSTLRASRESLGMTQVELSEQLGVPVNTVARWERGELQIEKQRLLALAMRALRDITHAGIAETDDTVQPTRATVVTFAPNLMSLRRKAS